MERIRFLTALLFAVLIQPPLWSGGDDVVESAKPRTACKCKHREVGESGSKNDWPLYDQGVAWHMSIDEAKVMAAEEGKLVFYYHIAGDLDKEGC